MFAALTLPSSRYYKSNFAEGKEQSGSFSHNKVESGKFFFRSLFF